MADSTIPENPLPQYEIPAVTLEAYQTLLNNLVNGVKEVQYADKRIVYQSVPDMWKILSWMRPQVPGGVDPILASSQRRVVADYNDGKSAGGYGLETEEHSWRTR